MVPVPADQVRSISIETSGPTASVALGQGDQILFEQSFAANVGHGGSLIPAADQLCRSAGWQPKDLHECYVSVGPGSFTGLRVAVAFARHLALAADVRIVAVPSMAAIAWNLTEGPEQRNQTVAVFIEAKKGMVFAATFALERGEVRSLDGPEIVQPAEYLATAPRPMTITGAGAASYGNLLREQGAEIANESTWTPRAHGIFALGRKLARAGQFTDPNHLTPLYVRRPEAEELWEKRQQASTGLPAPTP